MEAATTKSPKARSTTSAAPKKPAPVKKLEKKVVKAEPMAKPARKLSAMQVIRRTLAHNHNATVEQISAACKAAGVPKGDGTIATIRSDFMQTYAALREAGCIAK